MRRSLQLFPCQLRPNTTRGSKIFVLDGRDGYGSDAEYRCPVVPGRTFRIPQRVIQSFAPSRHVRFPSEFLAAHCAAQSMSASLRKRAKCCVAAKRRYVPQADADYRKKNPE